MKNIILTITAISLSIILAACGDSSSQGININDNQQVPFLVVGGGGEIRTSAPNNSLSSPTVFILHSQTDITSLWNLLGMGSSLPTINFNTNQFIAVVDSVQPTVGHSITITGVKSSSSGIIVEAVESSPGQGCLPQSSASQPFNIVSTQITTGTVTLSVTPTITNCTSQ